MQIDLRRSFLEIQINFEFEHKNEIVSDPLSGKFGLV
jgi:hypothetical protein